MNTDGLRRLILNNYDTLQLLMLSTVAHETYWYVASRDGTFSRELAALYDTSIQTANARLKHLFDLGYVTRITCPAPTGGIEYEYRRT